MLLCSPSGARNLRAFMPIVQSGDYFVVEFAYRRFGYSVMTARTTTGDVPWPVNEFIAYANGKQVRLVRAMRDSPRWEFYTSGVVLLFEHTSRYLEFIRK